MELDKASEIYKKKFGKECWFGRCIFLSWYCERGTCDFCFRSTQKHKIKHPENAKRSLGSIVAEAALIRKFNWKLEFLTGGYGILPFKEIVRIVKVCSEILGEKMWVNLGVLSEDELRMLKPYTQGIVSSLETIEPKLHDKVCPDKPIEPYLEMINTAKKLGFKQSFTLVIGLGEKKKDFDLVKDMVDKYEFDRVTVYALRPVSGTNYEKGPTIEEMTWWISQIRINFPDIEIIAGTAIYRIDEISMLLKAGANAFTKLPATKLFNTENADKILEQVSLAGRDFKSLFKSDDLDSFGWKDLIEKTSLTKKEKEEAYKKTTEYIKRLKRKS